MPPPPSKKKNNPDGPAADAVTEGQIRGEATSGSVVPLRLSMVFSSDQPKGSTLPWPAMFPESRRRPRYAEE